MLCGPERIGAPLSDGFRALLSKFQSTATAVHLSMLGVEVAAKIVLVARSV